MERCAAIGPIHVNQYGVVALKVNPFEGLAGQGRRPGLVHQRHGYLIAQPRLGVN